MMLKKDRKVLTKEESKKMKTCLNEMLSSFSEILEEHMKISQITANEGFSKNSWQFQMHHLRIIFLFQNLLSYMESFDYILQSNLFFLVKLKVFRNIDYSSSDDECMIFKYKDNMKLIIAFAMTANMVIKHDKCYFKKEYRDGMSFICDRLEEEFSKFLTQIKEVEIDE